VFGQPVTVTATVNGGTGTPTGTITFRDGATVLGTVNVANRSAAITVSTLPVTTHTITAAYSGDALFNAASGTLSWTVAKASTKTTLTASPNPVPVGGATTFTATVTAAAPGVGTPAGSVTFRNGTTVLGSATLNAAGVATMTGSFTTAGQHAITASYAGPSTTFHTSVSATLFLPVQ